MLTQPSSSLEYVRVPVRAEDAGVAVDPTDAAVQMAFIQTSGEPVAGDWKAAIWETEGTEFLACCLVGPGGNVLAEGIYEVWVKFTDNPEIPARYAGVLRIT